MFLFGVGTTKSDDKDGSKNNIIAYYPLGKNVPFTNFEDDFISTCDLNINTYLCINLQLIAIVYVYWNTYCVH